MPAYIPHIVESRCITVMHELPEGNAVQMQVRTTQSTPAPSGATNLIRLAKTGRDIIAFRADGEVHFLINSPEGARHVLTRRGLYSKETLANQFIKTQVADGILTAEGQQWADQRRVLNPALRDRDQVRAVATICVNRLVGELERAADMCEPVNLSAMLSEFTLAVTTRLLFGLDHERFLNLCENITGLLSNSNFVSPDAPEAIRPHREALYEMIAASERVRPCPEYPGSAWDAFADQSPCTSDKFVDQIVTLLLAGYETTANSLTWTWIELTRHPREYTKWQNALDRGAATSHTEAIFKECLRLYPPAWMIGRRALQEDRIGEVTIPANSVIAISPYLLHRHPRYWDRPDEFFPARFMPGGPGLSHSHAYLPFGAGPRFCIGSAMAMHEADVALPTLGARFRFHAIDEAEPVPDHQFVLRAPETYLVTVQRRL